MATSLLIVFAIGFFILLGLFLKNGGLTSNQVKGALNLQVAGAAPSPLVAPPPSPSFDAGTINIQEVSENDHIRGSKSAKITLVEFSDLECPFCKRFHPTLQKLVQEYDGKVRWVYRHLPLRSLHSNVAKEAEATECAAEQGKFWEYTDKIFEVTPSNNGLDPLQLPVLAEQIGLDRNKFEACLESGKYAGRVSEDEQDALAAGGQGTPYSVILTPDGKKIPVSGAVPFEQLKLIVDPLL